MLGVERISVSIHEVKPYNKKLPINILAYEVKNYEMKMDW